MLAFSQVLFKQGLWSFHDNNLCWALQVYTSFSYLDSFQSLESFNPFTAIMTSDDVLRKSGSCMSVGCVTFCFNSRFSCTPNEQSFRKEHFWASRTSVRVYSWKKFLWTVQCFGRERVKKNNKICIFQFWKWVNWAFLFFWPSSSINEVICHGIPDLRPLEKGDIINSECLEVMSLPSLTENENEV